MKKNEEREERKSRKILVPLATLAVASAVAVGSGATWTSTSHTNMVVNAGTILHENSRDGFTLQADGMVPGANASGVLTIENTGTAPATLTLTPTTASNAVLGSDLTLSITDEDGTEYYGTPFPSAGESAISLDSDFKAGEKHRYTFKVVLNGSTASSKQGASAQAAFEFKTEDTGSAATTWVNGLL